MKKISLNSPWLIFFIASLFVTYEIIQLAAINSLSSYLISLLRINAEQLGQLSAAYLYACILFVLPTGLLLDKFGVRWPLIIASSLSTLGTFIFAMVDSYWFMWLGRFLCGAGNGVAFIGILRLATQLFPSDKQPIIKGIAFAMAMLGGVLAQAPVVLLLKNLGWQTTLYINTLFGLLLTLAIALFVYEPTNNKLVSNVRNKNIPNFWQSIKLTLANSQNWLCGIYAALMNLPSILLGAMWGNLYLVQIHNVSKSTAANITSLIFYGIILGSPLTGWLSNFIGRKLVLMYSAGLLASVSLLIISYVKVPVMFIAVLFFLLGIANSAQLLSYTIAAEINPNYLESTSASFISTLINLSGAVFQTIFSWLIGLYWNGRMQDHIPYYTQSDYQVTFILIIGVFLLSILITHFIHENSNKKL